MKKLTTNMTDDQYKKYMKKLTNAAITKEALNSLNIPPATPTLRKPGKLSKHSKTSLKLMPVSPRLLKSIS